MRDPLPIEITDLAARHIRKADFLPTIKQYLYYKPLGDPERVQIVALWHTRRGSGPPI